MATLDPDARAIILDPPGGTVEGGFDLRDGINDDLSRVSDSFAFGTPLELGYTVVVLGAAVGVGYIGIQVFKALGIRGDVGAATATVVASLVLDSVGKHLEETRRLRKIYGA